MLKSKVTVHTCKFKTEHKGGRIAQRRLIS